MNILWLNRRLAQLTPGFVLLLVLLAIFESATQGISAEEASKSTAAADWVNARPSGFKIERYMQLWERNPFTLSAHSVLESRPSALQDLYLIGWLNDGDNKVVYVQNSQTNEVQRITARPNDNNLRLVLIDLNSDLRLVSAVIATDQERATVKFRFDSRVDAGTTSFAPAKNETTESSGQVPTLANTTSRYYPGVPRVRTEGGRPFLNKR